MGFNKREHLRPDNGGADILVLFLGVERGSRGRRLCPGRQRRAPGRHLPDGVLYRKHQLLLLIGLEQVVQRPHRNGLLGVSKFIISGQEEDAAVLVRLTDLAGHFQPGVAGHLNVQDDHLRGLPGKQLQRLPPVAGLVQDNQVAQILLQRLAKDFPLDQLILRHQQLALHARSSSSP